MSRKTAVLMMAMFAVTSIMWADAVSAQTQFQKVGRPWEVDGVALPYVDEGVTSDRGEGILGSDGYLRSMELRGPDSDTNHHLDVSPTTAAGRQTRGSMMWIMRWWLDLIGRFHL